MNIIYIVCHDLGRMLGCYGRPFKTPHLDRFAEEGVRFDAAFCQSPACSPSRGCALTGQPAHVNGLMGLVNGGWSLPLDKQTFMHAFSDAGYRTVLCGLDHTYRWRQDFPCDEDICRDTHTGPVVDAAIDFLARYPKDDQPFIMHLGTIEVHSSQWQKHARNRKRDLTLHQYAWMDEAHAPVPDCIADTPAMRHEMARFSACIAYHDFHLGRLFGALDYLGLRENTLVVMTTDHGIAGFRAKTTLYDAGTEIALLMRGPGLTSGAVVEDLVSNMDYGPTMLEAAGVPVPPQMLGHSFWNRACGGTVPHRDLIFTERNYHGGEAARRPDGTSINYDPMRAIRTPDYHLIRNFDPHAKEEWTPDNVPALLDSYEAWYVEMIPPTENPRPPVELYDVRQDPKERVNLAGNPALAEVRNDLLSQLEGWMRETADPLLKGPIPDRANPHPPPPDQRE